MSSVTRCIAITLAVSASAVGIVTSVSAALEAASTPLDHLILGAFAVVVTSATYLMPAVARRHVVAWALWAACLAVVLYQHAHYNIAASDRAGAARAGNVKESGTSDALRSALAAIDGTRTPAEVAGDLARAKSRSADAVAAVARCQAQGNCSGATAQRDKAHARVQALEAELAQATEARDLREKLVTEAREHKAARDLASTDRVDQGIGAAIGLAPGDVALAVGWLKAVVLELVAAMMWFIALQPAAVSEQRAASTDIDEAPGVRQARRPHHPPTAAPARHGLGFVASVRTGAGRRLARWLWPTGRERPQGISPESLSPS